MKKAEPLGIPSPFAGGEYMQLEDEKDMEKQLIEIIELIDQVMRGKSIPELQGDNKTVQFINWGYTELVYVLTAGTKKYTLLVGQPNTEFGTVKREYENLRKLYVKHKQEVVAPMYYIKNTQNTKEAYITPYLYQARCIADSGGAWGLYIPEPEYHFEPFSEEQKSIVNSCMIAIAIKLFDEKNNLGITSCHFGGGDFILEKGFEDEDFTYENILKRMKLIAARELVRMPLEEYIEVIRREFIESTFNDDNKDSIVINTRAKIPMTQSEIENGITLGLKLRTREKNNEQER